MFLACVWVFAALEYVIWAITIFKKRQRLDLSIFVNKLRALLRSILGLLYLDFGFGFGFGFGGMLCGVSSSRNETRRDETTTIVANRKIIQVNICICCV